MQTFATIITGVIVFVIGQMTLQFVLEPIKAFNKERGDTSYLLLCYQTPNIDYARLLNSDDYDLRQTGAALITSMAQIPFYDFLSATGVFGLPKRDCVYEAVREINGIALDLMQGNVRSSNIISIEAALGNIAHLLNIGTTLRATIAKTS